jgi:hypothetical protein
MWQARPKKHLTTIVKWLRTGSDSQNQWQAYTELAHGCLSELSVSPKGIEIVTVLDLLARHRRAGRLMVVEPQVRAMAMAMEERDRHSALAYADAASRWL